MKINWQYSRNQRRHYVDDGKRYGRDFKCLFEIENKTPYRTVNQFNKEGYNLYHKGVFISHSNTVKKLKLQAETLRG
jgi:HSP90 family molecular chaperone